MKECLNDKTKKYSGKEKTPLGLGYSASGEKVGKVMEGNDDFLYIVSETKSGKRWKKINIDLDNLDAKYYRKVYYPKFEELTDDETGLEQKFGGSVPFFIENEEWPMYDDLNLIFICQFKDPFKDNNELFRVFMTDDDSYELCNAKIMKIELNETNLSKQIKIKPPSDVKINPCHIIKTWCENQELVEIDQILDKMKFNKEDNKLIYDLYVRSKYAPDSGIKIGGTSVFCQYGYPKDYYQNFFQMSECNELPYIFGDAGIAHIFKRSESDEYYLEYDCC